MMTIKLKYLCYEEKQFWVLIRRKAQLLAWIDFFHFDVTRFKSLFCFEFEDKIRLQ